VAPRRPDGRLETASSAFEPRRQAAISGGAGLVDPPLAALDDLKCFTALSRTALARDPGLGERAVQHLAGRSDETARPGGPPGPPAAPDQHDARVGRSRPNTVMGGVT